MKYSELHYERININKQKEIMSDLVDRFKNANSSDEQVYYFGLTHNSSSARTIGINRTGDNGNNYYNPRGTSGITLMEIVA